MKTIQNITLAVLILISAVVLGKEEKIADTEEEKAKLDYFNVVPKKQNLYSILYTRATNKPVEVYVMDSYGKVISSEMKKSKKGFQKKFSFEKFPEGNYKIYVKDDEGVAYRKVTIERAKIPARILPGKDHLSFKVLVPETNDKTVTVKVFDKNNNLIKNDLIYERQGFIKHYELAKTLMKEYHLEVWMEDHLVAKRYMEK